MCFTAKRVGSDWNRPADRCQGSEDEREMVAWLDAQPQERGIGPPFEIVDRLKVPGEAATADFHDRLRRERAVEHRRLKNDRVGRSDDVVRLVETPPPDRVC